MSLGEECKFSPVAATSSQIGFTRIFEGSNYECNARQVCFPVHLDLQQEVVFGAGA